MEKLKRDKSMTSQIKSEIVRYISNAPLFDASVFNDLTIMDVLLDINPYWLRHKNLHFAGDFVNYAMDRYLFSHEETVFGAFLENVAIRACHLAYGGVKSGIEGIDLEFSKDGARYIVSIKSGPNWGNSSQIKKMRDNFRKAAVVLRQNGAVRNVIAVNGCCYGRENQEDKGDYRKVCGEAFWTLVSGDPALYTGLIEPIGHHAKERNDAFQEEYAKVSDRFTREFMEEFCLPDGQIDWPKIVRFNSSATAKK